MGKIVIYDGVCPKPYDQDTFQNEAMGGTEATVLRIESLLQGDGDVVLLQRGASKNNVSDIASMAELQKDDVVITLRDPNAYIANKARHPRAKHILWLHDVVAGEYRNLMIANLQGQQSDMVVVSSWHKTQVSEAIKMDLPMRDHKLTVIYNPVDAYCTRTWNDYDKNKLVFFSSPHKGLPQVIEMFKVIKLSDPDMQLYVANPGYYNDADLPEGVHQLGKLPHKQVMEHVRSALCTFYPQTSFPETFGLVLAESNALGTPVLSHTIGAANEVLDYDRRQVMDCRDIGAVVDRVLSWKSARPIVKKNPAFDLEVVRRAWVKHFRS